jgi:hypothetical protein
MRRGERTGEVFDELVSPGNVIATNTSSIPIAELAGKVQHPGRVVGVHFFSPVPVMKLVEVVVALDTDPETAEIAFAFAKKLDKHPIRTKDRSGFIVNFLLIGYVNAAIRMYEEGFASREDIDDGMRLGAGHPMGPDHGRHGRPDIVHSVGNLDVEEFKREEYTRRRLLKRMIAWHRPSPAGSRVRHVAPSAPGAFDVRATVADRDLRARERRLAGSAGHEALHAELLILGSEQRREVQALDLEPGVEAEVQPGVDRLLSRAQCQRGTRYELPGEAGCGAVHVSVRYDLVHQADPQGLLGVGEPPV